MHFFLIIKKEKVCVISSMYAFILVTYFRSCRTKCKTKFVVGKEKNNKEEIIRNISISVRNVALNISHKLKISSNIDIKYVHILIKI